MSDGVAKEKVPFSDVQRLARHCVCFSTTVHGLYACGDAETFLSLFHFYLRLFSDMFVKIITYSLIRSLGQYIRGYVTFLECAIVQPRDIT